MMTATDLASRKLKTLYVSLDSVCKLIDPKTPEAECSLELDELDKRDGNRQFVVTDNGAKPFLLVTKLPYKKQKLAWITCLAFISTDESHCCTICKVNRESASCLGKKVIELMR